MWLPWFLLAALVGAEEVDEESSRRVRGYAIPNVAFDTDDGLGFGGRVDLNFEEEGHEPYKTGLVLQAYWSLRGYHHHRIRLDRVGFGPQDRLRFTAHFAFRAWMNDGYWGIGPGTLRESAYAYDFDADDPRRKRYRYSLIQPFSHLVLRARLEGPWLAYGAADLRWTQVRTWPGSLLEEQQPYGMDGGWTPLLTLGVLRDTRQPEVSPREGTLAELSLRAAPPMPGGAGAYVGVFGALRWFQAVGDRGVVATRLMVDWLFGQVPFYEMVHWGGLDPIAGYGGAATLRGLPFGRFHAPAKALLNVEARIDTITHGALGKPLLWQVTPFVDLGVVWGDEGTGPRLPALPVHPSIGLGLRPTWDEDFVGRIDLAIGPDPVEGPNGTVILEPYVGFYLMFEHLY